MTPSEVPASGLPAGDGGLPLETLLPLRAAVVELRFTAPSRPQFFHQPALTAFLRNLLGSPPDYDLHLSVDAPEVGRTQYRPDDPYRFTLYALAGGEALLQRALERLAALPASFAPGDSGWAFGANLAYVGARDLFGGKAIHSADDLTPYDQAALDQETAFWEKVRPIHLRWHSPVRLLRGKEEREGFKGEARYCRDGRHCTGALLFDRLHDGLADLLRRRGVEVAPRGPAPSLEEGGADLFWVDSAYQDGSGNLQQMGGMLGWQRLVPAGDWPREAMQQLVLGQYLGTGQRRVFGWGRYRLETESGEHTCPRAGRASSLLVPAVDTENLRDAYRAILANRPLDKRQAALDEEWPEFAWPDQPEEEAPLDRLTELGERLSTGRYLVPPLTGVIFQTPDGSQRALAIPPFFDRIAQRAVAQTLRPGLEQLMYHGSHGYRPNRSRHSASRAIQEAYLEGYRWVYESDIDDFFDSVAWEKLELRLNALYGEDPMAHLVLGWIRAPVEYQGERIERDAGLPLGAPLSPLMANLMLDDFDSDLETLGFRLIRFADDFVVLCKDPQRARQAAEVAEESLQQLGLRLNADKTRILPFSQGFRYLGYLFVDGLALDVAGERGEGKKQPAQPSPRSWLARLGRRMPQALDESGALPPKSETAELAAVGETQDAGAMLFVAGDPARLSTTEGRLRVQRNDELLVETPWNGLEAVVLFGNHQVTAQAIKDALWHDVPIHFASASGRYYGVTWNGRPGGEGWGLWLMQQAAFRDAGRRLAAARSVVESRLRHQREVLRQRDADGQLGETLNALDRLLRELDGAGSTQELHGLEGQAARLYFAALRNWIPEDFDFEGRNRQPPRDPFNALLSLAYTVLYSHSETVLRASGLLPWIGFYHEPRGRHAALASDLMEPFRHLAERSALAAVARGRFGREDFRRMPDGACYLTTEARRRFLSLLSERFDTPIQALDGDEAKPLPGHLRDQNLALIAWLRGREPSFRAWRMR